MLMTCGQGAIMLFEKFFAQFDKKASDYFELIQLDPGFQIIFEQGKTMKLSSDWSKICEMFENYEEGSSKRLEKFMKEALHLCYLSYPWVMLQLLAATT